MFGRAWVWAAVAILACGALAGCPLRGFTWGPPIMQPPTPLPPLVPDPLAATGPGSLDGTLDLQLRGKLHRIDPQRRIRTQRCCAQRIRYRARCRLSARAGDPAGQAAPQLARLHQWPRCHAAGCRWTGSALLAPAHWFPA